MQRRSSSGSRVWGGLLSGTGAARAGADSSWKAITGRGCMMGSDNSSMPLSDSLLSFSSASKGWGLKQKAHSAISPCLQITCRVCSVQAMLYYTMLSCTNRSSAPLFLRGKGGRRNTAKDKPLETEIWPLWPYKSGQSYHLGWFEPAVFRCCLLMQ